MLNKLIITPFNLNTQFYISYITNFNCLTRLNYLEKALIYKSCTKANFNWITLIANRLNIKMSTQSSKDLAAKQGPGKVYGF